MTCCSKVGGRVSPESLEDLSTALLRARAKVIGAESLNAIAKRTGIRKEDLQRHRDQCLADRLGPPAPDQARTTLDQGQSDAPVQDPFALVQPVQVEVVQRPVQGHGRRVLEENGGRVRRDVEEVKRSVEEGGGEGAVERADGGVGITAHALVPSQTSRATPPGPPSELAPVESEVQAHDGAVLVPLRPPPNPALVESTYASRSLVIAAEMASGRWNRKRLCELQATWGVTENVVREYAKSAAVALAADRGQLEQQRQVSLGYSESRRDACRATAKRQLKIADEAKEAAEGVEDFETRARCLQVESNARKWANDSTKVELGWQEHADKISGVLSGVSSLVNVNVLSVAQSPDFESLMRLILGALAERWPDAHDAVVEVVRNKIKERQAERKRAAANK